MSALTAARNTPSLGVPQKRIPLGVEATQKIYVGSLCMVDTNGLLVPGQRIGGSPLDVLRTYGVCSGQYLGYPGQDADNTSGLGGAIKAEVFEGTFLLDIGGSSITEADIGKLCYAEDDHTVYDTSDTAARPVAGTIVGVEGGKVWVDTTRQSAIG